MGTSILRALGAPLLLAAASAFAQTPSLQAEQRAAFEAAEKVKVVGPAEVTLPARGTLQMPAGYLYVPQPEAGRLLKAMGGRGNDRLLGLVFPSADEPWFIVLRFDNQSFSFQLVTDADKRDRYRPAAMELLRALEYRGDKRYVDFDPAADPEPPGFLAKLAALLARLAKAI